MPLLNLTNTRAQEASASGVIGTVSNFIGNTTHGIAVFLTGATERIPVETPLLSYQNKESITVSSAALPLTANLADSYSDALITVETDAVRFWLDGTAPTASLGHKLDVGDVLVLTGRAELDGFRVIRVTTDATLRVSYANMVV